MKVAAHFLELSADAWRLFVSGEAEAIAAGNWPNDDESRAAMGATILSTLTERSVISRIVVGLDTDLVYTRYLRLASPREFRRRTALAYRLEEDLPLPAEELAWGYWRKGLGVLAVAVERLHLEPLFDALSQCGLRIDGVTPTVLLALAAHLRARPGVAREQLTWRSRRGIDLVLLEAGHAIAWTRVANTVEAQRQYSYWELERGETLEPSHDLSTSAEPADVISLARQTVERIGSGQEEPLLRLEVAGQSVARSPLQRSWQQLAIVTIGCLMLLTVANVWQAQQLSTKAATCTAAQEKLFRELNPGARLPSGIAARLRSDLSQLAGVRGGADLPTAGPTLPLLHDLLAALPTDMRYRVLELRLEPGRMAVSGEVRAHSDADRIAAGLRSRELLAEPPTTQRLPDQGVDFRLAVEATGAPDRKGAP